MRCKQTTIVWAREYDKSLYYGPHMALSQIGRERWGNNITTSTITVVLYVT